MRTEICLQIYRTHPASVYIITVPGIGNPQSDMIRSFAFSLADTAGCVKMHRSVENLYACAIAQVDGLCMVKNVAITHMLCYIKDIYECEKGLGSRAHGSGW